MFVVGYSKIMTEPLGFFVKLIFALWSAGECNSVEGDSGGEHKHHRKSFPRSSISGHFSFLRSFLLA
jgi:hypothetical protein